MGLETSRQPVPSSDFDSLMVEFEKGDDVTVDRLEEARQAGIINNEQYIELLQKLGKRDEFIKDELATAARNLENTLDSTSIDTVTGLKKREFLKPALERKLAQLNHSSDSLERRAKHSKEIVIFALDLDNLRLWNEKAHHFGDQALRVVADALKRIIQDSDAVFRLGDRSDEIVAILSSTKTIPPTRIEEIERAVNNGYVKISGRKFPVTASMAHVVLYPGENRSVDQILAEVDAKQAEDKKNIRSKELRIRDADARIKDAEEARLNAV